MRGEEAALAELGDLQVDVPGLGREQPVRVPLRWVVRVSVRSKRSAPIWAVASASMRAWSMRATPWRTGFVSNDEFACTIPQDGKELTHNPGLEHAETVIVSRPNFP